MITVEKLREALASLQMTDTVSCCTCGEELLVFRNGHKIKEIKTVERP